MQILQALVPNDIASILRAALIDILSNAIIQSQLQGSYRNELIYRNVGSRDMLHDWRGIAFELLVIPAKENIFNECCTSELNPLFPDDVISRHETACA